jgi:hypothetical protein
VKTSNSWEILAAAAYKISSGLPPLDTVAVGTYNKPVKCVYWQYHNVVYANETNEQIKQTLSLI